MAQRQQRQCSSSSHTSSRKKGKVCLLNHAPSNQIGHNSTRIDRPPPPLRRQAPPIPAGTSYQESQQRPQHISVVARQPRNDRRERLVSAQPQFLQPETGRAGVKTLTLGLRCGEVGHNRAIHRLHTGHGRSQEFVPHDRQHVVHRYMIQ